MMVYFRKRLTPEIIGEINEMIIAAEQAKIEKETKEESDDSDDDDKNSGTIPAHRHRFPTLRTYPCSTKRVSAVRKSSTNCM